MNGINAHGNEVFHSEGRACDGILRAERAQISNGPHTRRVESYHRVMLLNPLYDVADFEHVAFGCRYRSLQPQNQPQAHAGQRQPRLTVNGVSDREHESNGNAANGISKHDARKAEHGQHRDAGTDVCKLRRRLLPLVHACHRRVHATCAGKADV